MSSVWRSNQSDEYMISLYLIDFGYVLIVLNLILYAISFFRKEEVNVFLMLYLLFAVVMNLGMEVLYLWHRSNLVVMNLFFIGDMILIGLFFASILKSEKQKIIVKRAIVLALLVLSVQLVLDSSQLYKFNLFEIALTSLLLVVFALLHLYQMLTDKKNYYFFTIGVILYMSGSTILYLVGNLTVNLPDNFKLITWGLNAVLIIVYQLFILYEWKISFLGRK